MKQTLVFFLVLFLLYFAHDTILSRLFKKLHHKNDKFLGENAPDDVQKYFGRAVYVIQAYYLVILIYQVTGFTFWGLVSDVTLLDKPVMHASGFALGLLSLALMTLARLNLGSSWRVGLDHATTDGLVTRGFYRYIRNPYFTFLIAFEGSLILVSPNAVMIAACIQSILLLGLQVRQEEIFLEQKYGDLYREYKAKAGRFLPKFT